MMVEPLSAAPHSATQDAEEGREGEALRRLREQNPLAFRAFVVKHERAVFALLSRMLGRGPVVEDLAQETFLKAFAALPGFDPYGPAKVSTWLLTIATRLALDARKRKSFPTAAMDETRHASLHPSPEDVHARRELGRAIEVAVAGLPEDQRAVFLLAEFHGFSMGEIASAVDAAEATVKTRLFRAREKLRADLSPDWRTS